MWAVFSYLDGLYGHSGAVGFKLMYGQLRRFPELAPYLLLRRVRILHLVRQNLVDVVVSEERARITGASHVRAGFADSSPRVSLDPDGLVRRLDNRRRAVIVAGRMLRLWPCPVLETSYEQLLSNTAEFQRIGNFIGVPFNSKLPDSGLSKRGAASHRDSIANYNEVQDALAGTPYAAMLK
jgi:hypothetical protein